MSVTLLPLTAIITSLMRDDTAAAAAAAAAAAVLLRHLAVNSTVTVAVSSTALQSARRVYSRPGPDLAGAGEAWGPA